MRPKVFIVADWYVPGYKAGGLITALANLVDSVGEIFELYIFTRDRDLTGEEPYPGILSNEWQSVGSASVLYTADLSLRHLRKRILEIMPDIIYLNSFFSPLVVKTLCLRKLSLIPGCAFVLAPRGEFFPGALEIKSRKKTIFTNCALRAGLYRNVIWQATSDLEAEHIAETVRFGGGQPPLVYAAADSPSRDWLRAAQAPMKNAKGPRARFLFISRISRNKNLSFAVDVLTKLKGNVDFDIFGPIDDKDYWVDCQSKMKSLPSNIVARYKGAVPREDIHKIACDYDFFLFPTQGENFGYAILEAMAAGCPVVLSDRTPWQDLSNRGVGWALPLEDRASWDRVLQECVDLDSESYALMSRNAREFVASWAQSANQNNQTVELFNRALRTVVPIGDAGSPMAADRHTCGAPNAEPGAKEVLQ